MTKEVGSKQDFNKFIEIEWKLWSMKLILKNGKEIEENSEQLDYWSTLFSRIPCGRPKHGIIQKYHLSNWK